MKTVLFIGNFLSAKRGTIGPMEGVMKRLSGVIKIKRASVYDSQLIKMADMFLKSLFCNYEVIHIDTYSSNALYFAYITSVIGHLRKKKVILNLHGGALFNLYHSDSGKRQVIKKLFSKATEIVSPSQYLVANFKKEGYEIRYIPNTIDFTNFPYSAQIVNNHSLLWVRAFDVMYHPELAIKTLYEVRKKYPDATLTMIGPDKGLMSDSKKLVNLLGLGNVVHFVGKVPNNELHKYYTTHQVFLNTTDTESFGVAVMEAAACGIPIVTTSVGELGYLWNNETYALLIDSFNENDFADAVCRLFDDIELYKNLKKNAKYKADEFVWPKVEKIWLKVLQE